MNKAEMIDAIARHADISKAAAGRALDATIGAIKTSLRKGDIVTLVGFGSFYVGKRSPRAGPQSAHRRGDQDQGRESAEVPRWQSAQGCAKLMSFAARGAGLSGSGCLAQLVERRPYKANVGGSIPSAPTTPRVAERERRGRDGVRGVVVQLVRIPACHAGGRGFESRPLRQDSGIEGRTRVRPFS